MIPDFVLLEGDYSIYRLNANSSIPKWVFDSDFYSVTRTQDELSIVCKNVDFPSNINIKADKHWRILKINGLLDLSLVGIIANISNLFKENNIPIFTISTFDTDHILVKGKDLDKTITVINNAGHKILIVK